MGNGMPVLLTGDDFFNWVNDWEKAHEVETAAKEERRKAREVQGTCLIQWEQRCEERKQEIDRIKARWKEAKEKQKEKKKNN